MFPRSWELTFVRTSNVLSAARIAREQIALVLADVERFRTVNDSLGRQAGDELLKLLVERLSRGADVGTLARISGDVFAIVLQGIKGRTGAERRIEGTWRDGFSRPFNVGRSEVRISAKAGVSLFPTDGADAETLLRNAEAALRRAKETGERHVFHAPEMTEKSAELLTLETKLRQALENDELVLHYQPKVELETRRIVGMEALIRWQSPELGLVPPMKFIPFMEETGLILEAGAWALSRAIQLRKPDFVDTLAAAIKGGAAPPGIDLEITESLLMEDIEGNIRKLKQVRALGIAIAIDDFGTGYSSLGYLAKLPVQMLKIDRSFITTMLNDPDTMMLVHTIISLAHSLKLKVIAEGVESEEQAKFLACFAATRCKAIYSAGRFHLSKLQPCWKRKRRHEGFGNPGPRAQVAFADISLRDGWRRKPATVPAGGVARTADRPFAYDLNVVKAGDAVCATENRNRKALRSDQDCPAGKPSAVLVAQRSSCLEVLGSLAMTHQASERFALYFPVRLRAISKR